MVLGRVIHLVGPGGAGKSTVGRSLAQRLGVAFLDLDEQFMARAGDISAYLDAHGYEAYAAENVRAYLDASIAQDAVFALSSGFMTYSSDVHPAYHELRARLDGRVLMVAYTVRKGDDDAEKIRLISARRASRRERAACDAED